MARNHLSTTHLWSEQRVSIKGRPFLHRRCQICERDFARALVEEEWQAVHVGVLSLDFLDDEATQRWVSEDCPGHRLPADEDSERIRPGGEVHASAQRGAGTRRAASS